jgi:hypothetical protein
MLGRGYLWLKYSRDKYGWGKARNTFDALGPLEFIPEQLPSDNDVQGCYAGTVIRPMPIAEAHARFPRFQDQLKPISRYDWKQYGTLSMARRLDWYDRFRFGDQDSSWDNHYCDIRYTWVRDLRINRSGRSMQMGVEGSSWGYKVPSVGDLIVTQNPFNGLPESRRATPADCRVYPQLRLIITSPSVNVPMYDDTAFDWHGEIPVVQYDANDWAWSPMGFSLIRLVAGLEKSKRGLLDQIQTVTDITLDPPLGYDLHSGVSRTQLEKLDMLRSQGYRVGINGKPKDGLVSILPESIKVENEHFKQLEILDAERKKNLGLNDVTSLRELKMNVSEESLDKILEGLGPIATGISNTIGVAHWKIAQMLKYNIAQYTSVSEVMDMVGPAGVAIETYDNDPNSLVPSHLPGELQSETSKHEKRERAKWFVEKLGVTSVPSQLLAITQKLEKMIYLLFLQKGAKVSTYTIMDKLGVKNYGEVSGDTEHDKWETEQLQDIKFGVDSKIMAAKMLQDAGVEPQPDGGKGQGKGGGRPASGKAPPKLEQRGTKTGNPRLIMSQSD